MCGSGIGILLKSGANHEDRTSSSRGLLFGTAAQRLRTRRGRLLRRLEEIPPVSGSLCDFFVFFCSLQSHSGRIELRSEESGPQKDHPGQLIVDVSSRLLLSRVLHVHSQTGSFRVDSRGKQSAKAKRLAHTHTHTRSFYT